MDGLRRKRTWVLVNSAAIGALVGAGVASGLELIAGASYFTIPAVATLVTLAFYLSLKSIQSLYLYGSPSTAGERRSGSRSMEGDA